MGGVVKGFKHFITGGAYGFLDRQGQKNKAEFNNKVNGLDPGARPEDYKYQTVTDKNGNLKQQFALADKSGEFRDTQNQRQDVLSASARDRAIGSAAQGEANARANMASRGGLSGGMAAMASRNSQRDLMRANQDLASTDMAARSDIDSKAFDVGQDTRKINLGNQLTGFQKGQDANMDMYKAKMAEWGAGKTAQAQMEALRGKGQKGGMMGGVGGFLGK